MQRAGAVLWGRGAQPRALAPQVAAVLTLPFDVVKTQRQIELGGSEMHPGEGASCGAGGDSGEPPPAPPNPLLPSRSRSLQALVHLAAHAPHPRRVGHPGAVCG